ncbi:unnamed protein product [Gongylonema pulchrum]|uniref:DUF663 domain-containing protein n=1 Tax=Gongylonema pulchrum TaxID=637853 RepID=A0A183EKM9_9BILA|nr:unnamed protein product [Gongylonema pulchrum]
MPVPLNLDQMMDEHADFAGGFINSGKLDGHHVEAPWLMKDVEPFKQGAEARLYQCIYFGRKAIVKERFVKKYRCG